VIVDSATLAAWIEGWGFRVERTGTDGLLVQEPAGDGAVVVSRTSSETWEVAQERTIPLTSLQTDLDTPWEDDDPAAVLRRGVDDVTALFPLVEASTHADATDATVNLRAPVFADGLTRQAFLLTLSSVLKAAGALDTGMKLRAEQLEEWRRLEARSREREEELREILEPMRVEPEPTAESPATSTVFAPTHETTHSTPAWSAPDSAPPPVATMDPRVPVQVLERGGDWAHVLCENGWSGWIDGRALVERRPG
jgi:hypothetical protein